MDAMIRDLDDPRAIQVLAAITEPRLRDGGGGEVQLTLELARYLAIGFGLVPDPDSSTSEGDLARQALGVLADDPANREAVAALIRGPVPESFAVDPITVTALITFAMVVLKTRVHFQRDKSGKWQLDIDTAASSDGTVKSLA